MKKVFVFNDSIIYSYTKMTFLTYILSKFDVIVILTSTYDYPIYIMTFCNCNVIFVTHLHVYITGEKIS